MPKTNAGPINLDSTTMMMEPEQHGGGGLYVPGRDHMVYRLAEKSRLGLDFLSLAKRSAAKVEGMHKIPKDGAVSMEIFEDEVENTAITKVDGTILSNISSQTSGAQTRM